MTLTPEARMEEIRFKIISALLVTGILVVVGFIAIPNFISYRQRGPYSGLANSDVKNAFTASQAYFSDYPGGNADPLSLVRYGFTQSPHVALVFRNGTKDALCITSRNQDSATTYTVDSTGKITKG